MGKTTEYMWSYKYGAKNAIKTTQRDSYIT
jgi:hypothetical protein